MNKEHRTRALVVTLLPEEHEAIKAMSKKVGKPMARLARLVLLEMAQEVGTYKSNIEGTDVDG